MLILLDRLVTSGCRFALHIAIIISRYFRAFIRALPIVRFASTIKHCSAMEGFIDNGMGWRSRKWRDRRRVVTTSVMYPSVRPSLHPSIRLQHVAHTQLPSANAANPLHSNIHSAMNDRASMNLNSRMASKRRGDAFVSLFG